MRVLAFDTSTVATGWCVLEDGKMELSGVIRPVDELAKEFNTTKKAAKQSLTELETFRYITAKAGILIERVEPDIVVAEDSFFSKNASVLRILARLSGGILYHWLHKFDKDGTRTYLVMASRARATVGCKGNAKKPEVMAFIKYRFGVDITDDNIADAFILAMYGTIKNGQAPSEAQQPKARRTNRGRRCRRQ